MEKQEEIGALYNKLVKDVLCMNKVVVHVRKDLLTLGRTEEQTRSRCALSWII